MTLFAFADDTNLAAWYLDLISCSATTCLDEGMGLRRSTASQDFWGTICCLIGYCIFLSKTHGHSFQCYITLFTFWYNPWKKKCYLDHLLNPLWPGWEPLWASCIANSCKNSRNIILSLLSNIALPFIVNSVNIDPNFVMASKHYIAINLLFSHKIARSPGRADYALVFCYILAKLVRSIINVA